MKKNQLSWGILVFLLTLNQLSAQENIQFKGKVIDSETQKPLEYAVVSFYSTTDENQFKSNLTDTNGQFTINLNNDAYEMTVEFSGYNTYTKLINASSNEMNLGTIQLTPSDELLETIVIDQKRPDVEFLLDKKVYNLSENDIVKGGSATEVLEEIPSVEVDADGNVSLRGNNSVRIYIDGKNAGVSPEVLKTIPAESIDQVEVITNPSSRYSAEGSAGILNIKLKKGSNQGINGNVSTFASQLGGYGINTAINYKTNKTNTYAQLGYNRRISEGSYLNNSTYYNENREVESSIHESSHSTRQQSRFSGKIGLDWQVTDNIDWQNEISLRSSVGDNPVDLSYKKYDANGIEIYERNRQTSEDEHRKQWQYNTNINYHFDEQKEHVLTLSGNISKDLDDEFSTIDTFLNKSLIDQDKTTSTEDNWERQLRLDYVLPIDENKRFEAGYHGDWNTNNSSFEVKNFDGNNYTIKPQFLSDLTYDEKTHAFYSQYAAKKDKFNYMLGLRVEHSIISIDQKASQEEKQKKYTQFFPSLFLNYEVSETSSLSANYTRRIWRPRGRMINPVSSYSSSINYFSGNPDLDPSFTHVVEFSYLKRLNFGSIQAQTYYNKTENSIEYIRRNFGVNNEGIPITIIGPLNISTRHTVGAELNFSYRPFGWWRLNSNFNIYKDMNRGSYSYKNENNQTIERDFDSDNISYNFMLNNSITLPLNIQWQNSFFYKGASANAQGTSDPAYYVNTSLSKDLFNNNATLSLSVRDLLNSRKMIRDTHLPTMDSHVEMQWRKRMVILSFSYRFNQSKREARKDTSFENEDSGNVIM